MTRRTFAHTVTLFCFGLSACALPTGATDDVGAHGPLNEVMQAVGKPPPPPSEPNLDYSGYTLAWSDEFSGTALDTSVWTPEIGNGANGWGNNELEYYTDRPENVRVQNDTLIIEARKEAFNGFDYTSARLKTQGKKSFDHGIIEARVQAPSGSGYWPAFWLLGESIASVGWPACGEVDIMENKGTNTVYQYAHWYDESAHSQADSGSTSSADITQFHVYSARWDASSIKWYVDGVFHHKLDITAGTASEFHQPFFVLLNFAVGGNFPGAPRKQTVFPAQLVVDYVRVYQ